jgi:hypothetical protein
LVPVEVLSWMEVPMLVKSQPEPLVV